MRFIGENMANEKVTIQMELKDANKSIEKLNKEITQLRDNATATQKVMGNMGGTRTMASAKAASTSTVDRTDYNVAKGIAGATGAEARDFAKQSQGLGGLVRVYATFAANIFAVTAAFTALRTAADTTNMIKGLDQLGAASGQSLGSLSKRLVEVTDGAVSLREAMSATALATAGGMSSASLERLAKVAKNTSLALGISMPDALSRLSRGVTKLEPELLDELGILVRVDKASENYARSIGKTVSQLTDFEKRQGFTNAVLAEGEAKFGAIKLDANPYDKLAASFANLAQTGLELVNKVIGPIVSLLASSPGALAGILASIGIVLLKQAIPALSQWRTSMDDAVKRANDLAQANKKAFEDIKGANLQQSKDPRVQGYLAANAALDAQKKKLQDIDDIAGKKVKTAIKGLDGGVASVKTLQDETTARQKALEKEKESTKISAERKIVIDKEIASLKALTVATTEYAKAQGLANIQKEGLPSTKPGYLRQEAVLGRKAESAAQKAGSLSVVSKAKGITEEVGFLGGMASLGSQLSKNEEKLGFFNKGLTAIKGAAVVTATAITGLVSSLGALFGYIGIAIVAYELLSNALTKNEKEMKAYSESLDNFNEAGKTVDRTLELLSKKKPLEQLSLSSIQAQANAFKGLSDSILEVNEASAKALSASTGFWDSSVNSIKKLWGGDIVSKNKEAVVASLKKSLDLAGSGVIGTKFQDSLKKILKVPELDTKSMNEALSKLSEPDKIQAFKDIAKAEQEASNALNNYNSDLQAYKSSADVAVKASQDFNTTILSNDPMVKLGLSLTSLSASLLTVGMSAEKSQSALLDLVQDTTKLALLSPDLAKELLLTSGAFKQNSESVQANSENIKKLQKEYEVLEEIERNRAANQGQYSEFGMQIAVPEAAGEKKALDDAKYAIKEAKALAAKSKVDIGTLQAQSQDLISRVQLDTFIKGANLIEIGLGNAAQKAAITISKAMTSNLTGVVASSAAYDIAKREAAVALQQIDAAAKNTVALENLKLVMEELAAQTAVANAKPEDKVAAEINLKAILAVKEAAGIGVKAAKDLYQASLKAAKSMPETTEAEKEAKRTVVATGLRAAPYAAIGAQTAAKTAEVTGTLEAERIKNIINSENARTKAKQDQLQYASSMYKLSADELGIQNGLLAIQDAGILNTKLQLENASELTKQASERAAIEGRIAAIDILLSDKNIKDNDEKYQQIQKANELQALGYLQNTQAQTNINKAAQDRVTLMQQELAMSQRNYDIKVAEMGLEATRKNIALEIQQANFQAASQLGYLSESQKISGEYRLSVSKAEQDYQNTNLQKLAEEDKIRAEINTKKVEATSQAAIDALTAEEAARLRILEISKATDLANKNAKLELLSITKATALEQERINQILQVQGERTEYINSLADSLAKGFGNVGTAVGEAAKVLDSSAIRQEKSLIERAKLEKQLIASQREDGDPKEEKKIKGEIAKLDSKAAKDQITDIGNLAGATKKMFGEKTAAYKILNAVEKASHIAKVAMTIKEMFFDTAATGAAVANSGTRTAASIVEAGVAGVKAVVKAISDLPFPLNLAAGAATAAVVGGLLSSIGGSGPSVSGGASLSEERQKTQGTGTVFGDSDAKSESIAKSLEILSSGEPEQVLANRTQIKLLEAINDGIEKVAVGLYQVKGISSGSGFGTTEGTSGGGLTGLLFGSSSTQIIDSGLKLAGTFNSLRKSGGGLIQQYETVSRTSGGGLLGFLGGGPSTSVSESFKELDPKLTKTIRGVLGSMGTFFEEQGATLGLTVEQVNSVLDTVDVKIIASLKGLKGKELQEEMSAIFSQISDDAATALYPSLVQFRKFNEGFAETVTRVTTGLKTVKDALGSINDTFKELEEGVSTVTQTMLDQRDAAWSAKDAADAAVAANPTIQKEMTGYNGSYFVSVENQDLIDKQTIANAAYQESLNVLSTAQSTATANNVAASQKLIAAFGSESKFISAVNYFRDNFMTAGERLENDTARITNAIGKLLEPIISEIDVVVGETPTKQRIENDSLLTLKMKEAGVASLDSAESFRKVILAIEKTTPAGAELYASLSSLQEGFVSVYGGIKDTTKALLKGQELEDAIAEQKLKITNLIGTAEEKLQAVRDKELKNLDPQLRARQEYIHALEDEANLKEKLKTALTGTINALKTSINTLKDYKSKLVLSDKSTLTPTQKYDELKRQKEEIFAVATGTATTASEILAKNEAISKLPGISDNFLAASRTLYASSEQYNIDYASVLTQLDSTASSLSRQLTNEEQQLLIITASEQSLNSIKDSTKTTTELLEQYLTLSATNRTTGTSLGEATTKSRTTTAAVAYNANDVSQSFITGISKTKPWSGTFAQLREILVESLAVPGSAKPIYDALKEQGIGSDVLAAAINLPVANILKWAEDNNLPAFANGGMAKGLSLVGEKGPELVNFTAPGRVFSNSASNDLFNNRELVAEIRMLRKEVNTLRQEQKEQTGHIITTNYDANNKNADTIATATEEAYTQQEWKARSAVKIA